MKNFFKEWVVPAVIAFIIVMFLYSFVFELPYIPSCSMEPTIMTGDRLYVNKIFDVDKTERGDILVFKSDICGKPLIKRVIGLPGEKVEIKSNGDVYINNVKLSEPYAVPSIWHEQTFEVPDDCFLFFGDNRPRSEDARYWSNPYVNKSCVKGKAIFRIWPFNEVGKIE